MSVAMLYLSKIFIKSPSVFFVLKLGIRSVPFCNVSNNSPRNLSSSPAIIYSIARPRILTLSIKLAKIISLSYFWLFRLILFSKSYIRQR